MSSSRSRRSAGVKPHKGYAELRALRESGKTRLSSYKVEEAEEIYDEVDDEGYKKIIKDKLLEEDFVVGDNGEGYVDNGMDDWEDQRRGGDYYEGDEDCESEDNGKRLTGKQKREAEEARKKKRVEQEGNIAKYFSNAAVAKKPKPKAVAATVDDEEFMADLLGDFDKATTTVSFSNKRIKEEPVKKPRRLTPPLREEKKVDRRNWTRDEKTTSRAMLELRSSPPPIPGLAETDYMPADFEDEDIEMLDVAFPPSSPTIKAVQQKTAALEVEDEDDELTVMEIKGDKHMKENKVSFSASQPVVRPPYVGDAAAPAVNASQIDSSAWKNVNAGLSVTSTPGSGSSEFGKLNPKYTLDEDGTLNFFWIDYTEVSGALCLFGKVRDKRTSKFVSCFVKVDGILRNLFFLPREHRMRNNQLTDDEVAMEDVYEEVSSILDKHRIQSYKSKPCVRKYAFELPDIPRESDYLKVLYSYTMPPLDVESGETFSHVFGAHTAMFEQFVLCRNIMGPCWLKIRDPDFEALNNSSWCKLELQVETPMNIERINELDSDAPPLTLMSISLRTTLNAKDNKQEIIALSARIYENMPLDDPTPADKLPSQTFIVVKPFQQVFPPGFENAVKEHKGSIKLEQTEQGILNVFLAKLQFFDPDVLIGHQLENVDYSILLHRMKEKKTHHWHRIGRMRRNAWPQTSGKFSGTFFAERGLIAGRLLCDLANDLGKSLMIRCQSWSLTEMCDVVLGQKRTELDNDVALKTWASSGRGFLDYLLHSEVDTHYIAAIAQKIQMLPLTKQLTNLAGNSWARTMSGTRAERNEYILLHDFYRHKYICPDKYSKKYQPTKGKLNEENGDEEVAETAKKKDKYTGGLVLKPKTGLYDRFILVMDFNSLYPSIIQEFNICFTTVDRSNLEGDAIPNIPDESRKRGILPRLIANLVNRRREVKKLMKDEKATDVQKAQWDIKQQALKLTANSMYGCLGYDKSRFYARPLAALTTFKGREILMSTKELAESMQLEVIYGDTDSVMIDTNANNYVDAMKVGSDFKKAVNERYKLLEIDIDNVFQRLLLHAKKKYAALNQVIINGKLEPKLEVKGLDMRRREYCALSKEASSHVLNEIFFGDDLEVTVERIHEYLRELGQKVREGQLPLNKYTIYTKLGKEPKDYPDGKSMPHVQVALRKIGRGETVRVNDVIAFIITGIGASEGNPAERAYSPQDIMKNPDLKPDPEWYLLKQIFPPIERLCGPIDGTDAMRIAECLGLDTRKYQITNSTGEVEKGIHPLESTISDEERFRDSAKLKLQCKKCKEAFIFEGLIKSQDLCSPEGIICSIGSCKSLLPISSIVSQVEYQIRTYTSRYYEGWLICSDSTCGMRTRQMGVYGKRCLGTDGLGRNCSAEMRYEYSSKALYNQLLYFQSIFDTDKAKAKASNGSKEEEVKALATMNYARFKTLYEAVDKYLAKCGRQWVPMEAIFSFCFDTAA